MRKRSHHVCHSKNHLMPKGNITPPVYKKADIADYQQLNLATF